MEPRRQFSRSKKKVKVKVMEGLGEGDSYGFRGKDSRRTYTIGSRK
jgi:hypothetical protein